jgi:protein-tyrosine phosphatase
MLKKLAADGVDTVYLTPHYRADKQSYDNFISGREIAYNRLVSALETEQDMPTLVLGAEVRAFDELTDLSKDEWRGVSANNTILLELPYIPAPNMVAEHFLPLFSQIQGYGFNICLAHIERYIAYAEPDILREIISAAAYPAQLNCESLVANPIDKSRLFAEECLKDGVYGFLGTDSHNTHTRMPRFADTEKYIRRHFSDADFLSLMPR